MIGLVILLSFVLLMAVFRSIAIPIKAAIMNLLSMGAAYGVIVAVFQWGWLGSLFGVSPAPGRSIPWIPLMMFTIVFGLSMDYEVFLLSRIREEWLRRQVNTIAVADGLASTARVITAAAAIMVCVFGSFVINDPLAGPRRVRAGSGHGHLRGRHPGPHGAGAIGDATARAGQLVDSGWLDRVLPPRGGGRGAAGTSGRPGRGSRRVGYGRSRPGAGRPPRRRPTVMSPPRARRVPGSRVAGEWAAALLGCGHHVELVALGVGQRRPLVPAFVDIARHGWRPGRAPA